jgi:hypothetical protein
MPTSVDAVPAVEHDGALWSEALKLFNGNAKALTDAHLAQLALVSPNLGARATAKRQGAVQPVDPKFEASVTGTVFMMWLTDFLMPILLQHAFVVRGLKTRVADLEARPIGGVEYAGVHEATRTYQPGQLVTRDGSLWLCQRQTMTTPGYDPTYWKLIVKSH